MLYHVTIGDRTIAVDLADTGITVDGAPVRAAELLSQPGGTVHHMIVDGAAHTVTAAPTQTGRWELQIGGLKVAAEVVDERTRAIRAMTKASSGVSGPRPVKAPMPGLVVRIEVAVGDAVRAGQGVLIMEAMKMENELKADVAGVVARIAAVEGQAVEKGTVLIEFAAAEPGDG